MNEPLLEPRDRLFVVGKTGSGKSSWLKRYLGRHVAAGRRVLAIDPHDEYSRRGRASPHVELGPLRQRYTVDDLLTAPELLSHPRLCAAVVIARRPAVATAEDAEAVLDLVADYGDDLVLAADEWGLYGEHVLELGREAATQWRHQGIAVAFASQRLTDFHPKIRSQASRLVCGLQTHVEDLEALARLTRDPTFPERAQCLAPGDFIRWHDHAPVKARRKADPQ